MGARCMKRIGRLLWKHLKLQLKVSPIVISFLTLIWLPKLLTIQFENNPTTLQIATVFFLVIMLMYLITIAISITLCTIIDFIMGIDE